MPTLYIIIQDTETTKAADMRAFILVLLITMVSVTAWRLPALHSRSSKVCKSDDDDDNADNDSDDNDLF